VVETEVGMAGGAWSAATAAIGKREKTQRRAVLWLRRHGFLLSFKF
jgi:hypothetical protein